MILTYKTHPGQRAGMLLVFDVYNIHRSSACWPDTWAI